MKEKIARYIIELQKKKKARKDLEFSEFLVWLLLLAASKIYFSLNFLKWLLYKKEILKPKRTAIFTVSVGNIKVGGTGKSPLVIKIASEFLNRSIKTAVINRGYMGPSKKLNIISDGVSLKKDIGECSDEAFMEALALLGGVNRGLGAQIREKSKSSGNYLTFGENKLSAIFGARVMTSKERVDSIEYLEKIGFEGAAVLDDAFQYYRLIKDVNIVVLEHNDPFGNGMTFPAGMLRDRFSRLAEADIAVISKCPSPGAARGEKYAHIVSTLKKQGFSGEIYASGITVTGAYSENAAEFRSFNEFRGSRVFLFAGIADNASFFSSMQKTAVENGFELFCEGFLDHKQYGADCQAEILRKAAALGADHIMTTFKDVVKLKKEIFSGVSLNSVSFDLWISEEKAFFSSIISRYAAKTEAAQNEKI